MRVVLTGASGQLGAYLIEPLLAGGHERGRLEWPDWRASAGGRGAVAGRSDRRRGDAAGAGGGRPRGDRARGGLEPGRGSAPRPERGHGRSTSRRRGGWPPGAAEHGRRLVYTSTDLVFDGSRAWNREDDPAEPILEYGRTKREAEPARAGDPARAGRPAQPAVRPVARRARRSTTTGRSPPCGGASRRRSSRTSSARRSTWPRPPRSWPGWPSRRRAAWSTSPAASGSAGSR